MKKPLMSVPPAQAEALYDAALLNAPRGRALAAPAAPLCLSWDLLEWREDDAPPERVEAPSRTASPRKYTESSLSHGR